MSVPGRLFSTTILIHLITFSFSIALQPKTPSSGIKEKKAISTEVVVKKILNFSESEFFIDNPALLSSREDKLLDMDYMGIAINGPQKVLCDKQETVPIIMAMRVSGDRGWEVNLSKNCFIVATNRNSGDVRIAKAFFDPKERIILEDESLVKGPKPPGLPIASAQLTAIDVRKRIPEIWETGLWSVSVIYYDWLSNSIDLHLTGNDTLPAPVAANQVDPEPNCADTNALPCYIPTSKTPETPDSGVAFSLAFYKNRGKNCFKVAAAFSLIPTDFHKPAGTIVHQYTNGIHKRVTAIIPVTFIMLTLDLKAFVQYDWNVPVYDAPIKKGVPVKGSFAIDILSSENVQTIKSGTFVCYIAMDGRMYGPKTLQVQDTGK